MTAALPAIPTCVMRLGAAAAAAGELAMGCCLFKLIVYCCSRWISIGWLKITGEMKLWRDGNDSSEYDYRFFFFAKGWSSSEPYSPNANATATSDSSGI